MANSNSLESQDYHELIEEFLRTRKRQQTSRRYRNGLQQWLAYCHSKGVHPMLAKPADALLFAQECKGKPRTVNSTISSASSWYAWLVKSGKIGQTPFIGIPRRKEVSTERNLPSVREVRAILDKLQARNLGVPLRAAVIAMAYRGFPVGALPGLVISGNHFVTLNKTKEWTGELPKKVVATLKLRGSKPFADVKSGSIQAAFKRTTTLLANRGDIKHAYSVNDLRDFFAVQQLRKDRSWRSVQHLSHLLNHESVKYTQEYLEELHYTPIPSRRRPKWVSDLDKETADLLREVYAAVDYSLYVIASTGVRTILDRVIVEAIGDRRTYNEKLDALMDKHYIDEIEAQTISPVIEAGNASAHRGFKPTKEKLNDMLDITENLLEKIKVAPKRKARLAQKANALRAIVPKRPPLQTNP
jgi:site-specific recombinase XerD